MDRDVTGGWDNQAEEWSTVDEEIDANRPLDQGKFPSNGGNSGSSVGLWSLGGIVKSSPSKS